MADKISVIMPAYNVEEYIGRSIQSVLAQTYADFELIIINDGSGDNTASVIKEYQSRDTRIKYIEQSNQGVSVARNAGMMAATGRYISFLDADDLWVSDALEKMYSKMRSVQGCRFVYGRTEEIFPSGKRQIIGPADIVNGYLESFIHKTNELRLRVNIDSVLIDRELLLSNNILFESGIKISEDTGFFIELLAVTPAYGMNDIIAFYMRRENSATTHGWQPENWKGQIIIYEKVYSFVQKARPQIMPVFCRMRNYVAYRFILHCIRDGFFDDVHEGMANWADYLSEFAAGNGKFTDRLKCRAILFAKSHDWLLKIIGML